MTPASTAQSAVLTDSTPVGARPHLPSNSPYKGLTPYTADDTDFFFGRDHDTEIIKANLTTARLTLLYGASGVGKSSVLQAGVVHALNVQAQRDLDERGVPRALVVHFAKWRDAPVPSLLQTIQETILRVLPLEAPRQTTLTDTLRAWTERTHGELLLILDQFEEYFLYHQYAAGAGTFADEFPRALRESDLRVNFLLAFREDALAQLDRFKGRVPNLFKNILRVRHLDRNAARDAIVKPIRQYNVVRPAGTPEMEIEPALVDAVLEQVRVGKVVVGETGRGVIFDAPTGDEIETPYLQLVMTRLWEAESAAGSSVLRQQTLNDLGGAEAIVRAHLEKALDDLSPSQQAMAARIFDRLVTPSGAKIALSLRDLVTYAEVPEAELRTVLDGLASGANRILREERPPDQPDNPHYEIFHDVLARAVLGWSTRYEQDQQRREEQARLENARRTAEKEAQSARQMADQQAQLARRLRVAVVVLAIALPIVALVSVLLWVLNVPTQMPPSTLNIAVASFGEVDSNGKLTNSQRGEDMSQFVFNRMRSSSAANLPQDVGVTLWHDSMSFLQKRANVGIIRNEAEAAKVAEDLNVDLVLYGYLDVNQDLVLQFAAPGTDGAELTAIQQLVRPLRLRYPISNVYLDINLLPRLNALVWMAYGLELDRIGQFGRGYKHLCQAEQVLNDLVADQGREVLYYFLGREALFLAYSDQSASETLRLPQGWGSRCSPFENAVQANLAAEMWFKMAVQVNPEYASAYLGFGELYSQRAERVFATETPTPAQRSEARENFSRAINEYLDVGRLLSDAPDLGSFVGLKARAGLGASYVGLGKLDLSEGNPDAGLANFARAEEYLAPLLDKNVVPSRESRMQAQTQVTRGDAQLFQGIALTARGDSAEAKAAFTEALDSFNQCIAIVEDNREDEFLVQYVRSECVEGLNHTSTALKNLEAPQ